MARAPVSVIENRRHFRLRVFPVYWHLLSLDAPGVAVLWAWSFTRAIHAPQSWRALSVLGVGTWLLYIADRLLDSRAGSGLLDMRERHLFHARHRRAFLVAGLIVLVPLGCLILIMPAAARLDDACLFGAVLLYFAAVHVPLPPTLKRLRFPGELAVAIIFACAAAIPAWSVSTTAHADLVWMVALFALLCWTNCAAIHRWEAAELPRRWSFVSTLALIVAALAVTLMTAARAHPYVFLLLGATAASALLLFALDRDFTRAHRSDSSEETLSPLALRILADASLLTPLLLLLPWHTHKHP